MRATEDMFTIFFFSLSCLHYDPHASTTTLTTFPIVSLETYMDVAEVHVCRFGERRDAAYPQIVDQPL